ncbi:isopentenyl-diphosphate Delta-isomerase [Catenuloplanes atrovinosus]|uniref:Isopentenyl-diphosphate Delta-isomerase n=1 Tax=Catenuloplanes atrovinosus TaxID=137266 RepID=A0AAE4CG13_9ACTN|nr:isopentenyl-diphosphate Delta-isomerase [Catenuloplanes atrovinosus]MDR7280230.1 isopentenyl-diphosphate delta-isomerase [Catenuloplanes atrovinosus]
MTSREEHLVELCGEDGTALGSTTVADAHVAPGRLHRAFSVLLVDDEGRILLQQRAAVKTRFPLRWANACCGHPEPGESLSESANRRLGEELGVEPLPLTEIGVHLYYAEDPATGRVEHEYDHVLLGRLPAGATIAPDPDEVAELRWVAPDDLRSELDGDGRAFAPWFSGVAGRLFALDAPGDPAAAPISAAERSGGR